MAKELLYIFGHYATMSVQMGQYSNTELELVSQALWLYKFVKPVCSSFDKAGIERARLNSSLNSEAVILRCEYIPISVRLLQRFPESQSEMHLRPEKSLFAFLLRLSGESFANHTVWENLFTNHSDCTSG